VVDGLDAFSVTVWFKTSVTKSQQAIFQALADSTSDDGLEIHLKDDDSIGMVTVIMMTAPQL
jgi:hypothetical protein